MNIISINIGHQQLLKVGDHLDKTGIFKDPTAGDVVVTEKGLPEDYIFSKKHHGGPDQAIYIYGSIDYDWWKLELGRKLLPGTFGENLTIEGLESSGFSIGDRLEIGQVILEVTAPRIPCSTLSARMENPEFISRYRLAVRPGLYCRVIHPGTIQAGQPVFLHEYNGEKVSISELLQAYYEQNLAKGDIQRFLKAPLAVRWREKQEKLLERFPA